MLFRSMRVNRAGLADAHGVSEYTITNWLSEGLPRVNASKVRGQSDEYDVAETIRWRVARESGGNATGADGEIINFDAERARLTKEQADKVAMANERERGDLVSVTETAAQWAAILVNCKTRLLSIPTKAAPLVIGCKTMPQARDVIERFVVEALNDLSNGTAVGRSGNRTETAAETDREPVGRPVPEVKSRKQREIGRAHV